MCKISYLECQVWIYEISDKTLFGATQRLFTIIYSTPASAGLTEGWNHN